MDSHFSALGLSPLFPKKWQGHKTPCYLTPPGNY